MQIDHKNQNQAETDTHSKSKVEKASERSRGRHKLVFSLDILVALADYRPETWENCGRRQRN